MSNIKMLLFQMLEQDHELAVHNSDYGLEEAEEEYEKQQEPVTPSMPEVKDWVKHHDQGAYL